jgi:cytochrome P450
VTTARDADGSGLNETEIRDETTTFLVAGYETTAMALTWSLALLSSYPQARQRLEDEADAVPGDGPADPDQLPWTTAVVSEAMRLYPPAWTLERTALADDDVCGTPVPAGSMVAVLPYLVHRNPAVWPNPSGFDPARFLPGAPERHRYAWIPFGGGKRGCAGAGPQDGAEPEAEQGQHGEVQGGSGHGAEHAGAGQRGPHGIARRAERLA